MSLINRLLQRISGQSRHYRARRRREFSPFGIQAAQVQVLENRRLLSALTVTSAADSGAGSLRAEIAAANNGDTINFASSLKGQTITLSSGELLVGKGLTIQGPGAGELTISGGNTSRVFEVNSSQPVTLIGLKISHGVAQIGGAVLNRTALSINGCTISSSSATNGGAIENYGNLTVNQCAISGNSAEYGGGIYNTGTLTAMASTLAADHASANGGGIYNAASASSTLDGCTLAQNVAAANGGGIYNAIGGAAALANCTLAGNQDFASLQSGGGGGAIYLAGTHSTASLTNCTVSLNSAKGGRGGGIAVNSGGVLDLTNTIVAGNTGSNAAPDIFGTVALADHDLIGNGGGGNISNGVNGNIVGNSGHVINAMLGPLQNNGGPTLTMALLAGSPAIGQADNAVAPATDQRGVTRRELPGEMTDIGAFEL